MPSRRSSEVMKAIVLTSLLGCATSDRVALIASSAVIACDMVQTAQGASEGWRYSTERNPMLRDAGVAQVVAYALVVEAAHVLAWRILPEGWRSAYGGVVFASSWRAISDSVPRRHACFGARLD